MITNFSFGVPGEIADADYPMPLGNYFDIEKDMMQVGGEFLLVRDEESNFYFLLAPTTATSNYYAVLMIGISYRPAVSTTVCGSAWGWPERMLTAARCSGSSYFY